MTEHICASLVLTRGPEGLQRRLPVRLPLSGKPITIGRAIDNDVVLEMDLIFSSQWHCQMFAQKCEPETSERVEEREAASDPSRCEGRHVDCEGQTEIPVKEQYSLWLVDVGSSNGTFVNGIRVASSAPTPLHHGDVIVLGGMRDVEVGKSLPMEDLPLEIVTWRVAMEGKSEEGFGFVATPPVFLSMEFVISQARQRALGALQDSPDPKVSTTSPLKLPLKRMRHEQETGINKLYDDGDVTPKRRIREVSYPSGEDRSGGELARRSGTVAAYLDPNEANAWEVTTNSSSDVASTTGLPCPSSKATASRGYCNSDALAEPTKEDARETRVAPAVARETVQ
ncbi:kinetoplastid kinetochore protein 13 [Trypanosoma brucei equiperdum]|uniref:Kinetoplastid kinetochore protein 13 n=1 Tax=Trypanosoma brucei equiperdum TaxID=630700 RepID=A0A3L6L4I9_9TRYP|nr:kinetoplastid kinetochore protein 13 [Trypanosoma brucei equiperdum]